MNADLRRLQRWIRRAQPPRASLIRALIAGSIASVTSATLFVGAVALLVVSAGRPGLRAIAGILIVIELLAFLRSPIRYNERLSTHQLGFRAVSHWRKWLVFTVGHWDYSRWRGHAAGDLLERSLRDTDELQDLWLRAVVPASSCIATMVLGDFFVGSLPPHGHWWALAGLFALVQLLGTGALVASFPSQVRVNRALRRTRGAYQAMLVELGAASPEIVLLGASDYVQERSRASREALTRAERAQHRQRRVIGAVGAASTASAMLALSLVHPRSSTTWFVVVALVALATFDSMTTLRTCLDTAIAVSAAAERLEELEVPVAIADKPWPSDATLHAAHVTLREDEQAVVRGATLDVAPGRRVALTGPSGSGKSMFLRSLAALDVCDEGSISVGETRIREIREDELRRHLIYLPSEPGLTRGFAMDVVQLGRGTTRDSREDLAALSMPVETGTKWEELSRGERQRVAIVRAIATSPSILLLDEPTSGLGSDETDAVLNLLGMTGASLVIATHDPIVMSWCHEVLELRDGSLHPLSH